MLKSLGQQSLTFIEYVLYAIHEINFLLSS